MADVTISASVGERGKNVPADVRKINSLTAQIKFLSAPIVPNSEVCDKWLIATIRDFQSRFMAQPDGRIDPGGLTLELLNRAANMPGARRYNVPLFTQTTFERCWEACARMMWAYKHGSTNGYAALAGQWYLNLNRGLTNTEMTNFYRRFGMKAASASLGRLLGSIAQGPVVVTVPPPAMSDSRTTFRHAVVLAGYDLHHATLAVNEPCQNVSVSFVPGQPDQCVSSGTRTTTLLEFKTGRGPTLWTW